MPTISDTAAALADTVAHLAWAVDDCPGALGLAIQAREQLDELTAALAVSGTLTPVDLRQVARQLAADLRANRRPGITDANQLDVQALCVAEEAGELVGAYRRYAGKARRTGTRAELEDEIADVLIVTAVFAERAGIDINDALTRKLPRTAARADRLAPRCLDHGQRAWPRPDGILRPRGRLLPQVPRHRLGHHRRRIRPRPPPARGGMVPRPARPVRRRRRPVLLQAVGRAHPEGRRARARRAHLGPDARHHDRRRAVDRLTASGAVPAHQPPSKPPGPRPSPHPRQGTRRRHHPS